MLALSKELAGAMIGTELCASHCGSIGLCTEPNAAEREHGAGNLADNQRWQMDFTSLHKPESFHLISTEGRHTVFPK